MATSFKTREEFTVLKANSAKPPEDNKKYFSILLVKRLKMAAQPLAPGALMAQAVQQQELMKLPRWHNNPAKDAYKAEHWWMKFEFAAIQGQWNWAQIQANFFNAMFDKAVAWYQSIEFNYVINDIDALKNRFLSDFAQTANQRSAITDVRISQGSDTVINYWSEVHRIMMELELSVTPYVAPANNAAALPRLHARAGAAGADAVAAAHPATLLTDHQAHRESRIHETENPHYTSNFHCWPQPSNPRRGRSTKPSNRS